MGYGLVSNLAENITVAFERWSTRSRVVAPRRRQSGRHYTSVNCVQPGMIQRRLWREFRMPVLLFLFVTFIGGFVYGELYSSGLSLTSTTRSMSDPT